MRSRMVYLLILFLCIFCVDSYAFDISGREVTVDVSSSFVSRYIWRGQDLYKNNDGAHQHDISATLPESIFGLDLYLDLWASFPVKSGHEDAEELDYTLSLSHDLFKYFSGSAGFTYFDFPNANKMSDVAEPWFSLTLKKIPVIPLDVSMDVFAGYDFKAASGGPEEGWYYSWGLDMEIPLVKSVLFQEGQTLAIGVTNWGNDGVAGFKPAFIYATEFSLSTTYKLKNHSITPSLNYSLCHEDQINSGDDELWAAIEINYSF